MGGQERKFVVDIKGWELPVLDALEENLVKEISRKRLAIYLDEETLGEQLYKLLFDRVRQLAATAVNETITYWLQGLADGNGEYPELCAEFPYLRGDDTVAPLTVAYVVGSEDGSRTEIIRIDLSEALMQLMENETKSVQEGPRAKVVVAALRELADRFERAHAGVSEDGPHAN